MAAGMMTKANRGADWSIYRRISAPQSRGRVPLRIAFEDYCCMRWGLSGEEIADGFDQPGSENVRMMVGMAVELLGGAFVQGIFATWARPLGGGLPEQIPTECWELDDLRPRFASCSINMRRPYDPEAEPTHLIFVDAATRDAMLDACCIDLPGYDAVAPQGRAVIRGAQGEHGSEPPTGIEADAIVRLAEVKRLTGLARSTIYARMKRDEFPQSYDLGGRQTGWHAADISDWLARRPARGG